MSTPLGVYYWVKKRALCYVILKLKNNININHLLCLNLISKGLEEHYKADFNSYLDN